MKADRELRDLVLDIFRDKGEVTIAGMVRELDQRGVRHHRLTVTGYLHALADQGVLEVRDVPPAKLFTLRRERRRGLSACVGEAARRIAPTDTAALELTVAALERLLDRPVFLSELTEAGFTRLGGLRQLAKKERAEAAERLARCGVEVREGEPLYRARAHDEPLVQRVVREALLDVTEAQGERLREVKQARLTLEQFG